MTYRGSIKNGIAVLDTPVTLPDGIRVRVEVEPAGSEFWGGKNVEALAGAQGIQPINNLADLAVDRPAEESIDEFLALIREVRH